MPSEFNSKYKPVNIQQTFQAAHPNGELDQIRIMCGDEGSARIPATQIRFSDLDFQDDVFVDPCSGSVLGGQSRYG